MAGAGRLLLCYCAFTCVFVGWVSGGAGPGDEHGGHHGPSGWGHGGGDQIVSSPDECPVGQMNSKSRECVSLREETYWCRVRKCCSDVTGDEQDNVNDDDESQSGAESSVTDETGGRCRGSGHHGGWNDGVCTVYSRCTRYVCSTDCCQGYFRGKDGMCYSRNEVTCHNGGTLAVAGGYIYCQCSWHFRGPWCETPVCWARCRNGGRCVAKDGESVCECQSMYYGSRCQHHGRAPTTAPPITRAPTTMRPTTRAPTTVRPTTRAPTTVRPTTRAPTTMRPTTRAPTTMRPTTRAPTTVRPTTRVPTTMRPTTRAPTTMRPTTRAPTTERPTTRAPTTVRPTTRAPTTMRPTTRAPTTMRPTTRAPTTERPTTRAPTTVRPTTRAPTTMRPTTRAPTTIRPTTRAPTTVRPTTRAPTTMRPTTRAPTTIRPTTRAPTTERPSTRAPTTVRPTTRAPTTMRPTTRAPTTMRPTTKAPTTMRPITEARTNAPTLGLPTITCPSDIVELETPPRQPGVAITKWNSRVQAHSIDERPLEVSFSQDYVKHCACLRVRESVETIHARTTDRHGQSASCSFQVRIKDPRPPVLSCPSDVYVNGDEPVMWKQTVPYDNVGLKNYGCTPEHVYGSRRLASGEHHVTCWAMDFDGNQAKCSFTVHVNREENPGENSGIIGHVEAKPMSEEDETKFGLILGPVIGGLVILAIILGLLCCLKFRKSASPSNALKAKGAYPKVHKTKEIPKVHKSKEAGHKKHAPPPSFHHHYDNHIYNLPYVYKHDSPPPSYSSRTGPPTLIRTGPPSQVGSTRDMREVEYAYFRPPTYAESMYGKAPSYISSGYDSIRTVNTISSGRSSKSSKSRKSSSDA